MQNPEKPLEDSEKNAPEVLKKSTGRIRTILLKLFKWFTVVFFSLLSILIVLTGFFFFTHTGSEFLWNRVKGTVSGLDGEMSDGNLANGFRMKNFRLDIEDTIHVGAGNLEIKYSVWDLLYGQLNVRYLKTSDVLLVLGNRPDNLPVIGEFLERRLYENYSFAQNEQGDMVRIRESAPEPDPTLIYMPAPNVVPEAPETEQAEEDDGERFVLDMPVNLSVKNIEIDRFLMLSDIIDVAVEKCEASASMNHSVLNVDYLSITYGDSLLHGEDREALLAMRAGGEEITYDSLLSLHPEYASRNVNNDELNGEDNDASATESDESSVADGDSVAGTSETADTAAAAEKADKTSDAVSSGAEQDQVTELEAMLNDPYDRKEIEARIQSLYTVILPFDLYVEKVTLKNSRYHMDSFDTGIFSGGFKMTYIGPEIHVDRLYIDHELGHAELLDSDMTLDGYYPIEAHLQASSNNQEWYGLLHNHTLEVNVVGDLADLSSALHVRGSIDADIRARSNVLAPGLPFNADIDVKHAFWPLDSENIDYAADSVKFHADGSLREISATFDGKGIIVHDYPVLNLSTGFVTDFGSIDVKKFEASSEIGDRVSFSGKAIWQGQYSFDGKLDADIVDLGRYLPEYEGHFKLGITPYVHYQSLDEWFVRLSRLGASGEILGYPLSLTSGKFEMNSSLKGIIEGVHLVVGNDNRVDVSGKINKKADILVNIDLQDISTIFPEYYGVINGTLKIDGELYSPVVSLKAFANEFVAHHFHVANTDLDLQASFKDLVLTDSRLRLYMEELRKGKNSFIKDLDVTFSGSEAKHTLKVKTDSMAGPVSLRLDGGMNSGRDLYTGTLQDFSARARDISVGLKNPVNFRLKLQPEFSAVILSHTWLVNDVKINISEGRYSSARSEISLDIPELDLMHFKKFLPAGFMIDRPLGIHVHAGLDRNSPFAVVKLKEGANALYYNRERLDIKNMGFTADFRNDNLKTSLVADFGKLGSINSLLNINQLSSEQTLGGSLDITALNMIMLQKFSEDINSSDGILNAHGRYAGSLGNPAFYGQLKINEMSINPAAGIGSIKHINTTMDVDGRSAQVNSSFSFNEKYGNVNGQISWENGFRATIAVKTDELPIQLMGYGDALVKLDLKGKFTDRYSSISGDVEVPSARIRIKDLPASSVSASSDITEYTKDKDGLVVEEEQYTLPFLMSVNVKLGPEIRINALGLKTKLGGTLKVRQRTNKPLSVLGKIELEDGTFRAYGQNLLIEQGVIAFIGDPSSPNLNIRAIRNPQSMEDDNVTVGINVSGNANSPNVKIFSRPEMNQSEALSYLLRGRGLDQTNGSSDMATQLLLGVGLMQTNSVLGSMGEVVGLEEMSLDSKGEGDDTSVEVSAYILPKVQVAYGYGIYNAVSEFRIRYEMFPRFYIEALSSIEQAVDAVYKFDFDF